VYSAPDKLYAAHLPDFEKMLKSVKLQDRAR
jgi:hypothetical protein